MHDLRAALLSHGFRYAFVFMCGIVWSAVLRQAVSDLGSAEPLALSSFGIILVSFLAGRESRQP